MLKDQSKKQQIFQEMVLGILLYTVVLGFFNDYSDILYISSYSVIFLVAVVMQVLTYFTFIVKGKVAGFFKNKDGFFNKSALVFGVWLVLFLSKFVFLWVIELLFPESVQISGFIGLLIIIALLTISQKIIEQAYNKLSD